MVTRRIAEETARLGDAIYERDIRARLENDHHGEYVAIDVDSGCWAIGGELLEAADRLRAERPRRRRCLADPRRPPDRSSYRRRDSAAV